MGKQFGGPFANWTKKVGNVVAREVQGRTVLSIYQPNVSNPQTTPQMSTRQRFSLLSKLISACLPAVKIGFADLDGYKTGSAYSAAVGYNLKRNPFTGSYPAQTIVYADVEMSKGSLLSVGNPSVSADSGVATFVWSDNSGQGNAEADDKVIAVIYNSTRGVGIQDLGTADRSTRTLNVTLPSAWNGESCDVWLFVQKVDKALVSTSVHLGTITA